MNALVATLLSAAALEASQAGHPDFSGTWTLDTTRSETLLNAGSVDRGPVIIAQEGDRVRITSSAGGGTVTPSRPGSPSASPAEDLAVTWLGPTMVTLSSLTVNGQVVTVRRSRSLSADGAEMVVETAVAVHHGYEPGGPLPQSSARDVYVRADR